MNSIELTVDMLFVDTDKVHPDDKGLYKVHEKDIFEGLRTLFSGMFVNKNEEVAISLLDGALILRIKILSIENIKPEYRHLTYGVLEDRTDMNCKPSKASVGKIRIMSDRV